MGRRPFLLTSSRQESSPVTYLHREAPASSPGSLQEGGAVVVEVEHGDVHGACGAAGWAAPVLHPHQELVAALPLAVQGVEGGHFSWECGRGGTHEIAGDAEPEAEDEAEKLGLGGAWEGNPG